MRYGLDLSSGEDYSAVVVLDGDGEIQQLAFSTDQQHWNKIMEEFQQAQVLKWGADFL